MKESKTEAGPKVRRTRRRLYDPLPAEEPAAVAGPEKTPVPEPERRPEPASETVSKTGPPDISQNEAGARVVSREREADKIIKDYSRWSAGTALIPVPLLDMAIIAGIQVTMVRKLCELYALEYSKERVKTLLAALLGGGHAGLIAGSLFKAVPLIGAAGAVTSSVAVSGAITYAIGKVFVQHFETGGNLLNFKAAGVKAYYEAHLREGGNVA